MDHLRIRGSANSLLTSTNVRSTAAVRHMKAVSRNGQYCCGQSESKYFFTKVRFTLILKDINMKTKDSIINLVIESLLKNILTLIDSQFTN